MKRVHVYFDPGDAPQTGFDLLIQILLSALLIFCPLTFGAVHAWSEEVFICIAAAMAICLMLKLIARPDARFVLTWAYAPIVIFLLLVGLQLLRMPAGVARMLSPATARTKSDLLADFPNAAGVLRSMTITFYSEATIRQLRLLLAVVIVFIVVVNVYQRIESIKRLLVVIAAVGAAMAILALAQDVTRTQKIFWLVQTYSGVASSATFENHSHFCQFMNLSIGAMLALLLLQWHTFFQHGDLSKLDFRQKLVSPEFRMLWALGAAMILAAASVLLSLSRGGVISMLIASLVTVPLIATKAHIKGAGWAFMLLVIAVLACGFYLGSDMVFRRLESITQVRAQGSRIELLKDLTRAWRQFPVFGTGLGSFRYIFPMFDTSHIAALATHAENEYAQTLTETGAIGLAMALCFIGIVGVNYFRAIRGRRSPSGAIAIGLGYGLLSILIHSLSDFGQHVPANAILTAISCGLMVSVARLRDRELGLERAPAEFRGSRPLRIAGGLIVTAGLAITILGANQTRIADDAMTRAGKYETQLSQVNWRGSDEQFLDLLSSAKLASDTRPKNVSHRYWLNVYRWNFITSRSRDPQSGLIVLDATKMDHARRLVNELNQCRLLCPTFGPAYCEMGQIEKFILDRPEGAAHIRKGFELAPHDPGATFVAARLEASEGNWPQALALLRRTMILSPGMRREILEFLVREMNRPEEALKVAEGDAQALSNLTELLENRPQDAAIAQEARRQETTLLRAAAARKDCDAPTLVRAARGYVIDGELNSAIDCYRRAIRQDYGQTGWHFELAKALANANRRDEAINELRICLIQQPRFGEADAMLRQLEAARRR